MHSFLLPAAAARQPAAKGSSRFKQAFLLSALVAAAFGAVDAEAALRYVRAGATGNGSGADWANAYPSLPSTLVRGDTYYVAAGSYAGRNFNTPVSGTTPITIKKATVADHGTATGWSDGYGTGQAAFTSGLTFSTGYWVVDGQTGGGAPNRWLGTFGFKVTERGDSNAVLNVTSGGSNVSISHVDLEGKGSVSSAGGGYSNDGLAVYGATNVTLSYYRMAGIGRCPFFLSPRNVVIEHGWVEKFYGSSAVHSELASIWAFSGSVGDVTFRHNLFTDIQSTGGIMWDNSSNTSARLLVYGNVFYKPAGASWGQANGVIGGWTGGGGEQFRNAAVYNNTFINVDQESLSTFPNVYSNNVAYNNLFYNSQSPNFAKFALHDNNHFINSGGTHSESNGTSATSGDPFVDYVNRDFRLKTGTAAGASFAAPFNVDGYGVQRGADGTWDRGAYESGSGGTTAAPMPPANLRVL